ncbi:DUF4924 family protein [Maribellus sp. YY47]|uniref:DUF4924 family protein n=1 Tax=Maribellus sp. YY47 TaxID=2929486 RepID=UPI002001820A|nr:DUF4924 family protein [Maribellus sp. YY47]MCK3682889.1 DUF4924 family protein [Maribellus sp. YY47]
MLVAKQKRKENIVEYILYLYQVEDLIRAFKLDMNQIEQRLVSSYKADDKTKAAITDWYANLILMMEREQIREKGHLQFLKNLISDVNEFHLKLMETKKEPAYVQTFQTVAGLIRELSQKNPTAQSDVEIGITAVYGFLLLRMQKKEISLDTTEAIQRISKWMGELSKLYRDFENDEFSFG